MPQSGRPAPVLGCAPRSEQTGPDGQGVAEEAAGVAARVAGLRRGVLRRGPGPARRRRPARLGRVHLCQPDRPTSAGHGVLRSSRPRHVRIAAPLQPSPGRQWRCGSTSPCSPASPSMPRMPCGCACDRTARCRSRRSRSSLWVTVFAPTTMPNVAIALAGVFATGNAPLRRARIGPRWLPWAGGAAVGVAALVRPGDVVPLLGALGVVAVHPAGARGPSASWPPWQQGPSPARCRGSWRRSCAMTGSRPGSTVPSAPRARVSASCPTTSCGPSTAPALPPV